MQYTQARLKENEPVHILRVKGGKMGAYALCGEVPRVIGGRVRAWKKTFRLSWDNGGICESCRGLYERATSEKRQA